MKVVFVFFVVFFVNLSRGQDVLDVISLLKNSTTGQNSPSIDFLSLYSQYKDPKEVLKQLSTIDSTCMKQIVSVIEGVEKRELWAIQMWDASAKLPAGLLSGNILSFGNYEECIEVQRYDESFKTEIKGQYCSALLTVGRTTVNFEALERNLFDAVEEFDFSKVRMSLGLCVPSACNARDLKNISDAVLPDSSPLHLTFLDNFCTTADSKQELPTRTIIGIIIFSSFGMLLLLGTVTDLLDSSENNAILKCFSMYTNGKKLLSSRPSENSLLCLNGLRVLSMMLIILGHRYITTNGMPAINKIVLERWKESLHNYIFIGLGFAVDTFFVISGLLVVFLFMKAYEQGQSINWGIFYLHRLLRLTPSLAMIVLFYSTMVNLVEHEPFAVIDDYLGQTCRDYWWSTMLYIQNYWNPNNMCAVHTWYLAIDTQLYFLSPFLLIALTKFPRRTISCMVGLIILSILAAFEITLEKRLGATYLNQNHEEYKYLYTPTHIRIPPWLLGAITGYFISQNRGKSFKISKFMVLILWMISLGSLLLVLLGQKYYHDNNYNVWYSSIYNALARPLWGAAVCVVIILCVFGYGGIINNFLSCSLFNVLIRINYAVYLVHMMVQVSIIAKIRVPIFISNFNVIHETLGDYFVILLVAIIWTLAFESPIIALEKLIFSKDERAKDKNDSNISNGSCETIVVK